MPRTRRKTDTKRLQVEMTVVARERLEEIREELGVATLTDVVVRSFSLLDTLHQQTREGGRIFVRDADGKNEREVILVF